MLSVTTDRGRVMDHFNEVYLGPHTARAYFDKYKEE